MTTSEPVEVEQPVKRKKKRRQKKRKDVAKAKDEEMSDVGNKETLSTDSTGQGRKRLKRKIPLENTEAGAEEGKSE